MPQQFFHSDVKLKIHRGSKKKSHPMGNHSSLHEEVVFLCIIIECREIFLLSHSQLNLPDQQKKKKKNLRYVEYLL